VWTTLNGSGEDGDLLFRSSGEGRLATVEVPGSQGGDARGSTPTQYVVRFAGQAQYLGGSVASQHKARSVTTALPWTFLST